MKRAIRIGLALILAGLMAAPVTAQPQAASPRAAKGELVVVQLRDKSQIVGEVGKWLDDLGFYVTPPGSAAYLIHCDDVVSIRAVKTGAARRLPAHEHRGMTANKAAAISVFATIGFMMVFLRFVAGG